MAETQKIKPAGGKPAATTQNDDKPTGAELQTDQAPEVAEPGAGAGTGGDEAAVVKADEEISDSLFAKTEPGEEYVTLAKDVVEEFYFPDTKRPSYRLLFTKGQVVRRSEIDALNSRVAARRAATEGEFLIDSTTVASGTRQPADVRKDDEGK